MTPNNPRVDAQIAPISVMPWRRTTAGLVLAIVLVTVLGGRASGPSSKADPERCLEAATPAEMAEADCRIRAERA
jgi:hypothetical protein